MIIMYGISAFKTLGNYHDNHGNTSSIIAVFIFILGVTELGVGIWACVSCCGIIRPSSTSAVRQATQNEGVPRELYFMAEVPDGTFAAVPAEITGSTVQLSCIPVYIPVNAKGTQPPPPPPPPYEPVSIFYSTYLTSLAFPFFF